MNVKIKPKTIFVKPKINHCPISTKPHTYTIDVNNCIICLDNNITTNNLMHINTLKCKDIHLTCNCNYHIHLRCLLQWVDIKPLCPTCRAPIRVKNKKRSHRNQNQNRNRNQNRNQNQNRNVHRAIRSSRTTRSSRRSRRVTDDIYDARNYNEFIVNNRNINNNVSQLQAGIFLCVISMVSVILIILYL